MKLYLVSAYDPDEYKGNPDRGRFVFADSADEALEFWRREWIDDDEDEEVFLPTLDCVVELPPSGERGIVYGVVLIDGLP